MREDPSKKIFGQVVGGIVNPTWISVTMEIVDLIRQSIPDFEFVRIDRIQTMKIAESSHGLSLLCNFAYCDGTNLEIEFLNIWNVSVVFDGGHMQLGEFFVAPLKNEDNLTEGYRVWDELTGLHWNCTHIVLISITPNSCC